MVPWLPTPSPGFTLHVYDIACTVYDRIEARAFISYKSFLTRRLNKTGVNLDPGVYFLLATR